MTVLDVGQGESLHLRYPDGRDALENARLREDGYAVWEEEDYCTPPLAQKRVAALDEFFDDLEVTVVEKGDGPG